MESLFSLHFFEMNVRGSMCQILVLFFEMGNIAYGSFAVKNLSLVNTLFFDLMNLINLCRW